MTTTTELLAKGYFPRELPPNFVTDNFSSVIAAHRSSLPAGFTNNSLKANVVVHNLARAGTLRRRLSVPNPVLHFQLCAFVEVHWSAIAAHVNASTLSRSIPIAGPTGGRALIPCMSHSELTLPRARNRSTGRFLLKADVSRFYHSIYTHSIPWALHTKAAAKADRSPGLYGNQLDKRIRQSQDEQTLGIPVGPDTSLVFAEILLSSIDQELIRRIPTINGFRHVDDYELCFSSRSEAETSVAVLEELLARYELSLNPTKTVIEELPIPLEAVWAAELRTHKIRSSYKAQATDINYLFDRAFTLAREYPNASVISYAISCLRHVTVHPNNWELLQYLLLQCVLVEPGTFLYVTSRLIELSSGGYSLDARSISKVMNDQIVHHAPRAHGSEVAWAIWTLMRFGIHIEPASSDAVANMEDSIVALLALDARARGLIPGGLNTTRWEMLMSKEELYGDNWLLVYEAGIKGWLPSIGGGNHVRADPNFSFLEANGVYFYDSARTRLVTPTGVSLAAGRTPHFTIPGEETAPVTVLDEGSLP